MSLHVLRMWVLMEHWKDASVALRVAFCLYGWNDPLTVNELLCDSFSHFALHSEWCIQSDLTMPETTEMF